MASTFLIEVAGPKCNYSAHCLEEEGIGNVRLMVGVRRRDKTKIQYCITALTPVLGVKDEEKSSHK